MKKTHHKWFINKIFETDYYKLKTWKKVWNSSSCWKYYAIFIIIEGNDSNITFEVKVSQLMIPISYNTIGMSSFLKTELLLSCQSWHISISVISTISKLIITYILQIFLNWNSYLIMYLLSKNLTWTLLRY